MKNIPLTQPTEAWREKLTKRWESMLKAVPEGVVLVLVTAKEN